MKSLCSLALFSALCGFCLADDKKDPTAGKWTIESVTRDGKDAAALKGAIRVHENGTYTITPPKDSKAAPSGGTYTVDASKTPHAIDMMAKGGNYDGKTLLGIAKVDGDTLTICFAEPGKERPKKFESAPGSGLVLMTAKKAK
jgi:uncharacterized protein (TIGR03067 family)